MNEVKALLFFCFTIIFALGLLYEIIMIIRLLDGYNNYYNYEFYEVVFNEEHTALKFIHFD